SILKHRQIASWSLPFVNAGSPGPTACYLSMTRVQWKRDGMTDDLAARHRAALPTWMPIYYEKPIAIVSGKGRRPTDTQCPSSPALLGGAPANMPGYDSAEVRDGVERQLHTGVVHSSTLYLIRHQVELAEKIARLSGIPDARVFFTNSGSEANEAAMLVTT